VSVATGIVADTSVNADYAYEIGQAVALNLTGKTHGESTFKRKDRVISIHAASSAMVVRGQEVEINSTLLFMRVTCIIKRQQEMAEYLQYEFAKRPPSLFDKGIMRKNTKSVLANIIKQDVVPYNTIPTGSHYVIDGGNLLQSVVWPKDGTYGDVCATYVAYVNTHYAGDTICIFDGYADKYSTKVAEQNRCVNSHVSAQILFSYDTKLCTTKKNFLNNRQNKSHFIELLMFRLNQAGIICSQSRGDADHLIVFTALHTATSLSCPVILVGNDTDLLTILVDQVKEPQDIYMQFTTNPVSLYSISDMQQSLSPEARTHILVAHAFTGCDTVSALFGVGKKKILTMLTDRDDWTYLADFKKDDASHDEITNSGGNSC
jgi:hypothetical protein